MFEKKAKEKEAPAPESAESATAEPTDPHMTRPEFIQALHHTVNEYAEHWDQGRIDKDHPEPTTRSGWRADFESFLSKPDA